MGSGNFNYERERDFVFLCGQDAGIERNHDSGIWDCNFFRDFRLTDQRTNGQLISSLIFSMPPFYLHAGHITRRNCQVALRGLLNNN